MGKAVGIDLGTTYSAIAILGESGKAEILANRDGERTTPSVVYFQDDGSVLVGTMAKRSAAVAPLDVVDFVKRQMGNPDWRFDAANGRQLSPEEVSALILKRLKEDAELYLGEGAVTDAVITVPAYFDDAKRRATKDAGRIAGLNVLRVLNEPTAAALAYGEEARKDGTILVFDLGGGTFDVTVMTITNDVYDVKATDGLHELGGKDWDDRLMTWLNQQFQNEGGPDLTETFESEADLREKAEAAKRTLSQAPSTKVILSSGGVTKSIPVSREQFESITVDLLNQARDLTISLVEETGLGWAGIDHVLLVGGSIKMPMVARMLEEISGRPPLRAGNPDELVALGAGIQAAIEAPSAGTPRPRAIIKDVTSQGLGVAVLADDGSGRLVNSIIIPRNTKIPAKGSDAFTTSVEGQTEVHVQVTQGDDEDFAFVKEIGDQLLTIPPYPKGAPIRVEFAYDIDQMVSIAVYDLTTDSLLGSFEVDNTANLSDEDIRTATDNNNDTEVG
ncbi:molecular chaperone DnaK [Microbacterium sp. MRS-1]|uniref:Hsp70 family protein n=1 Tax=Candidatus Microsaccharimonas sossegonensis TaxID=2506948 RepID=A0A4Q0AH67_9BACT|nr:molecular chaperone DnaK [Microbacterium sp. MRS-1]RWZ78512.1 MAG: Hsp70 family protein [Candidatus Microsaccharimonas sossegonensis]